MSFRQAADAPRNNNNPHKSSMPAKTLVTIVEACPPTAFYTALLDLRRIFCRDSTQVDGFLVFVSLASTRVGKNNDPAGISKRRIKNACESTVLCTVGLE